MATVLAIDVGSNTIKMAEFSYLPNEGNLELEKFAFEPIFCGDENPVVVFSRIYQYMIQAHGFKSKDVRLTISGQLAFSRLSKLPELSGDDSAIARVIEFEAKQTVPYAMDEVLWGYQLIQHEVEAVGEFDDPTFEYEALFVAVKKDLITNYTDVILESGKNVLSVNVSPIAMVNTFVAANPLAVDECQMLLNIGGQASSLVICQGARVFIRNIPIAGDAITMQISKEFGIPIAEAEDLKRKHGFVALGGAYEDPDSEVAATISKIARNVMTRLHGEINRSINVWRSQHNGIKPTKLLISGGGALIQYVTEFFEEKLSIPVDYLNVFGVMKLSDNIDKEELLDSALSFAELSGMGVSSVFDSPVEINLLPDTIKIQKEIQSKRMYFYISAVTIILSLLIFMMGIYNLRLSDEKLVRDVAGAVNEAKALAQEINNEYNAVNSAKSSYERYREVLTRRNQWTNIYNEIQDVLPHNVWIGSIEGIASIDEDKQKEEALLSSGTAKASSSSSRRSNPFSSGGPEEEEYNEFGEPMEQQVSTVERDLEAIKIKGYALILNDEILIDKLKENLKNTQYFNIEESGNIQNRITRPATGENNLTAFTLYIKLKNPIKMN